MVQVQNVLKEIGAEKIPQLLVFNKLDALAPDQLPLRQEDHMPVDGVQTPRVFVSARNGQGLALLRTRLAEIAGGTTAKDHDPAPPQAPLLDRDAL